MKTEKPEQPERKTYPQTYNLASLKACKRGEQPTEYLNVEFQEADWRTVGDQGRNVIVVLSLQDGIEYSLWGSAKSVKEGVNKLKATNKGSLKGVRARIHAENYKNKTTGMDAKAYVVSQIKDV